MLLGFLAVRDGRPARPRIGTILLAVLLTFLAAGLVGGCVVGLGVLLSSHPAP